METGRHWKCCLLLRPRRPRFLVMSRAKSFDSLISRYSILLALMLSTAFCCSLPRQFCMAHVAIYK